jgi:hypothetical protein
MEPTAYSVRSCLAPASGSGSCLAFGILTHGMTDLVPRIYADAHEADADGRFWLHIPGSRADIDRDGDRLQPGMRVLFNVQDEFEVEGTLAVDEGHGTWLGRPDDNPLRYP